MKRSRVKTNRLDEFIQRHHVYMFIIVVLVGLTFRFYDLPLRLMHHDEASGHFSYSNDLCEGREYVYDPVFHGPFLYHMTCLGFKLLGVSDFSLRFMPALFGSMLIIFFYLFRKEIGTYGYLIASSLIAVSPSFVYFSRFLIHDMFFLFFLLSVFYFLYRFYISRKIVHWMLLWISFGLLFTVKENAYPTSFVILSFFILHYLFHLFSLLKKKRFNNYINDGFFIIKDFCRKYFVHFLIMVNAFFWVMFLFYSSGFRFSGNIVRALSLPVAIWMEKSTGWAGHFKPFYYYFRVIWSTDLFVALLGIVGLIIALKIAISLKNRTKKNLIMMFLSYYALGNMLFYVLMPYKTPWLIVNILLPFFFLAGIAVENFYSRLAGKEKKVYYLFMIILLLIVAISAAMSHHTNFIDYDSYDNKLAYVQTHRNTTKFLNSFFDYADSVGHNVTTLYIMGDFWPEKWYTRGYNNTFDVELLEKNMSCSQDISNKWCVNLSRFSIIMIDADDAKLLDTLIDPDKYNVLTYNHRDGLIKKAYFKKVQ